MAPLEAFTVKGLILLTLLMGRVLGMVSCVPIFGSSVAPIRMRAIVALAISFALLPTQWNANLTMPVSIIDFGRMLVCEVLLGLALGMGLKLLLAGVQLAGQVIAQLSGMSLPEVLGLDSEGETPLLAHLLYMVALTAFVVTGGHRQMVEGLLSTYQAIPPGAGELPNGVLQTVLKLMSESFTLGVRVAAPAIVALLLATIALGIVSRMLPQLNLLVLGFGANCLITLGVLALTSGATIWLFSAYLDAGLSGLIDSFHATAARP